MKNRLYECEVTHRRLAPKQKRFDYRIFMLWLDLDDLPKVPWLGLDRFNLFSLENRDHLDLGHPGGIKANLLAWLRERNLDVPSDVQVRLLTLPRVLGYSFNPVSFYYLNAPDGTPLLAVAEVVNTYREMKLYPIEARDDGSFRRTVAKDFYVSPFSEVRDSFDFNLGFPDDRLAIKINTLHEGEVSLVSAIRGSARPLTGFRLFRYAFKYPFLSFKVILMIHFQAFGLWLRKVPFFAKAAHLESQRDVLRPHSSITPSHEHENSRH